MSDPSRRFGSIKELFDAAPKLNSSQFDDSLWLILCAHVQTPLDLVGLPGEVSTYYASRLLQWEVGNGGFAQAAYNVPEWFSHAARGYDELGHPEFAKLIRQAQSLIPADPNILESVESQLEEVDESLSSVEWEIDDARIAFVKQHRESFVCLDRRWAS
jgi:hypothetical protein